MNQTGQYDHEIICVNDGSTDGSRTIVQSWAHRYPWIRLIDQDNQGPSMAVIRGLVEARGDYIRCVDADDMLHPQATEIMIHLLKKTQADAVVCSPIMADSREAWHIEHMWTQANPCLIEADQRPLDWDDRQDKSLPLMLFTRNALLKVHGCDSRIFVQDYHLSLKLFLMCFCIHTSEILYFYRKGVDHQLSKNRYQEYHDASLAEALIMKDYPDDVTWGFRQRAVIRAWHRVARMLHRQKQHVLWIRATMRRCGAYRLWGYYDHQQAMRSILETCTLFQHYVPIRLTQAYQEDRTLHAERS